MDTNELIRLRAYEYWVREGQPEGRELEHWLMARRDILGSAAEQRDENPPRPVSSGEIGDLAEERTVEEAAEPG